MTVAATLRDAKALIEAKGWTQNCEARNARGAEVSPHDPGATCFCGVGAIVAASLAARRRNTTPAIEALSLTVPGYGFDFPVYNDEADRIVEDVLARFDEAIALAEAEQKPS